VYPSELILPSPVLHFAPPPGTLLLRRPSDGLFNSINLRAVFLEALSPLLRILDSWRGVWPLVFSIPPGLLLERMRIE